MPHINGDEGHQFDSWLKGTSGAYNWSTDPNPRDYGSSSNPFGDNLSFWQNMFPSLGSSNSGILADPSGGGNKSGFGWNMPTAYMLGQGLGGIGNLARGWAAIKGLDVAKDSLNFKKDAFNENMQNQTSLLNNQIRDRNIFKQKTMTPGGYQLDKELTYNRIG